MFQVSQFVRRPRTDTYVSVMAAPIAEASRSVRVAFAGDPGQPPIVFHNNNRDDPVAWSVDLVPRK